MDDEIEIPIPDLNKMGWDEGGVYILLFLVLIILPLVLVATDLKDKEITIDSIKTSFTENIINIDVINKIRNLKQTKNSDKDKDKVRDIDENSGDPVIVNPDEIPPKTCADINGNPDNSVVFNCEAPEATVGGELKHNYESIICLNSGCTELDCCSYSNDSCKIGIDEPSDSVSFTDDYQRDGYYINHKFNTSDLLPDSYTHNTQLNGISYPLIINCNTGYKNTTEYANELREIYSRGSEITDYEKQAIITCNNGVLDFGDEGGACSTADLDAGYYQDGNFAVLKECRCDPPIIDGITGEQTEDVAGIGAVGADCPIQGHLFCASCNSGADPVLIGEGDSQISTCRPDDHAQPCNMDDLTINNGQITPNSCSDIGTTCLITCDNGYHLDREQPICEGGIDGHFSYNNVDCVPDVCTQPDRTTGYQFDNDTPCSNLQYGNEDCSGVTCLGDTSITPEFNCENDGEPITLSGCPAVCDTSSVSHIERVATNIISNVQQYRDLGTDEMVFNSSNCGSPGNFISEGQECDITCPDGKSLVSDAPTCTNGTLTTDRIQCASTTCSIGTTIPENATLVSGSEPRDAGDYDCTNTDTGTTTQYYSEDELNSAFCLDRKCTDSSDTTGHSLDTSDYNPTLVGFPTTVQDANYDRDGDGLSDWLEFGGRTDNYSNIPDNDDWDNRISTLSWFYDMYGEDGTNRIIKNTTTREPPQYGNSCMIKCDDGYQYVPDSLQTCSEYGQEISGNGGRCELIPQEAVDDSNVKYLLVSKNNRVNETVNCSIACNDGYAFICPTGEDTANENKPQCINPTPEENYYGDNLQGVINNIKSADAMVYLDSLNNLVSASQAAQGLNLSPNPLSLANPFVDFDNDLSNFTPSEDGSLINSNNNKINFVAPPAAVNPTAQSEYSIKVANMPTGKIINTIGENQFNNYTGELCFSDPEPLFYHSDTQQNYLLCKCNISNCNQ